MQERPLPGDRFGNFRIEHALAPGALVHDEVLDRRVARKLVRAGSESAALQQRRRRRRDRVRAFAAAAVEHAPEQRPLALIENERIPHRDADQEADVTVTGITAQLRLQGRKQFSVDIHSAPPVVLSPPGLVTTAVASAAVVTHGPPELSP